MSEQFLYSFEDCSPHSGSLVNTVLFRPLGSAKFMIHNVVPPDKLKYL